MTECLWVNIDTSDFYFSINLTEDFKKFKYLQPVYLHFTLNFNNIQAVFGNNVLYLNDTSSQSITLSDGCYDI